MARVQELEGLPEELPVFVGGFSNGGGFAPQFADLMIEEGWDIRGALLHNTAGVMRDLPTAYVSSENDVKVSTRSMRNAYETTQAQGWESELYEWNEIPVTAERLRVMETVDADEAQAIVEELVTLGLIDESGERLFDIADLEPILRFYKNNTKQRGAARTERQLRVIWATHRLSGFAASDEVDFLLRQL